MAVFCNIVTLMRIAILSAEILPADIAENQALLAEIEAAGHQGRVINYSSALSLDAEIADKVPEIVIPRINEVDETSLTVGNTALLRLIDRGTHSYITPTEIDTVKDKSRTADKLEMSRVPTPKTITVEARTRPDGSDTLPPRESVDELLAKVEPDPSRMIIFKRTHGTHGRGVFPAPDRSGARAILEAFPEYPFIVQEYLDPEEPGRAISRRLVVIGGGVIAAMKLSIDTLIDFRTNYSLDAGAKEQKVAAAAYNPSPDESEVAVAAAQALDLQIAGVDLVRGKVVDLNAFPGFHAGEVAGVNIPRQIVAFAIKSYQKTHL